jgi:hypothetical protein
VESALIDLVVELLALPGLQVVFAQLLPVMITFKNLNVAYFR